MGNTALRPPSRDDCKVSMTDTVAPGEADMDEPNTPVEQLRQVTLEDVEEPVSGVNNEISAPESDAESIRSEVDDDFGDFGDFDEYAEFEAADQPPAQSDSRMNSVVSLAADLPVPFSSYHEIPHSADKLREFFNVHQSFAYGSTDHLTPTSQILWEQLMANPEAMLIEWNKSAVHRRLAVALGAPLDLDQSLPKAETRKMALPEKNETSGLPDSSLVPHWRLLTLVSGQAIKGMTDDELSELTKTLKTATEAAELLQQEFESVEMSLNGEKEVLEGMVESLLVYAQKSQRTKLQKRR